jgi:outer membrane protein assembly factor BamB
MAQREEGMTTVLQAGPNFVNLAQSKLGERTFASYAVADRAIYLRTESQLYRIERE